MFPSIPSPSHLAPDRSAQFIAEFITEGVEMLERIANPVEPPETDLDTIFAWRNGFKLLNKEFSDMILPMHRAFVSGQGDLNAWKPEVLAAIDKCFVANFMEDGKPVPCLFSAQIDESMPGRFLAYWNAVDDILVKYSNKAPRYARHYFAYYSICYAQRWIFPMPLVTASVVECLHLITSNVRAGMVEVRLPPFPLARHPALIRIPESSSHTHAILTRRPFFPQAISWVATLVSWTPKITSRSFVVRDQFDAMISAMHREPGVKKIQNRLGNKVGLLPIPIARPPMLRLSTDHRPTQIHRVFFLYLRSSITMMTIGTHRSHYREFDFDLKDFDAVLKDHRVMRKAQEKSLKDGSRTRTRRSTRKGKKKATEEDDDEADNYNDDDDDNNEPDVPGPSKRRKKAPGDVSTGPAGHAPSAAEQARKLKLAATKAEARAFMESCSDLDTLADALKEAQRQMAIQPFTREDRRSPNYVLRILATCGWRWNVSSNYKSRDFWQIALAAVLESIIVPDYRLGLLEHCPGSLGLRYAIKETFLQITEPISREEFDKDGKQVLSEVKDWDFADAIQPTPNMQIEVPMGYYADDVEVALLNSITITPTKSMEEIKKLVTGMMKNPYLACSQDGVAAGTLESSAYFLLNELLRVSHPRRASFPSSLTHSGPHPQIMAINLARIEHIASDSDYPFDPSSVTIPDIITLPHARTEALEKHVSPPPPSFHRT